jgi:uncharacterized membrane protein
MAFCAKCGTSLQEGMAFCISCGAPVAAKPAGAAPTPPSASATAAPPPAISASAPASSTGMEPNVAAALSYLVGFITGIIFLVIEPYNRDKFVRFHAFQSIFLNVAWVIFWIGFNIVGAILTKISFGLFGFIMLIVDGLLGLLFFLLWLFLMFKAFNKERFMVPIIGALAAKQADQ